MASEESLPRGLINWHPIGLLLSLSLKFLIIKTEEFDSVIISNLLDGRISIPLLNHLTVGAGLASNSALKETLPSIEPSKSVSFLVNSGLTPSGYSVIFVRPEDELGSDSPALFIALTLNSYSEFSTRSSILQLVSCIFWAWALIQNSLPICFFSTT